MPLLCANICTSKQIVSTTNFSLTEMIEITSFACRVSNSYFKYWSWVLDVLITDDYVRHCFAYWQGQFPCPLHSLGEAMPQYWFRILEVLEERCHSNSVHSTTIPSLLITGVDIITSMFSFLHLVTDIVL